MTTKSKYEHRTFKRMREDIPSEPPTMLRSYSAETPREEVENGSIYIFAWGFLLKMKVYTKLQNSIEYDKVLRQQTQIKHCGTRRASNSYV